MIQAGFARGDITPEPGPVLQGHFSTRASHAVLHPLGVRSAVWECGALRTAVVTVDVVGLAKASTDRIRKRVAESSGIPDDNLMVASSHTHCAPATLPCLGTTPARNWLDRIEAECAACVARALEELQPVSFGLGDGSAHFNISRRPLPGSLDMKPNFGGLVDRRVRVLRMDGADGNPMGVLFHYSCHPTTKSGSEGIISPDYPGIARRVIEREFGCPALFLPGCFGNIRPAIIDPGTGGFTSATEEQLEDCGQELGTEVVRVTQALRTEPSSALSARRADVEIPFGDPMPEQRLRELAQESDDDRARLVTGPWARGVLEKLERNALPRTRPTEMQLMTVGPVSFVSIPGEPVQEIGHAVEKQLSRILARGAIWPVGYANDEIGYLCTTRHYDEGGYEPNAYPYYGEAAPFRDEETVIVQTAAMLAKALLSEPT